MNIILNFKNIFLVERCNDVSHVFPLISCAVNYTSLVPSLLIFLVLIPRHVMDSWSRGLMQGAFNSHVEYDTELYTAGEHFSSNIYKVLA